MTCPDALSFNRILFREFRSARIEVETVRRRIGRGDTKGRLRCHRDGPGVFQLELEVEREQCAHHGELPEERGRAKASHQLPQ